jgi:hypothetical protein
VPAFLCNAYPKTLQGRKAARPKNQIWVKKRGAARSLQMITDLAAGPLGLICSQQQFEILNWFLIENGSAGDHCSN